jgi:hypothetical protein
MSVTTTIEKRWADLSVRAQTHIRATRPHLIELWDCFDEDAGCVDTCEADTAEEALDMFEATYDRDMYDLCDPDDTVYVGISVRNTVTGEEGERTLKLAPVEPACVGRRSHEWKSPHEVVGGSRDNPGVFGAGAGVRIVEVCAHCGVYRSTETQAQRRDTGEYAGARVSYRPADDDSRAWVRRRQNAR